MPASNIPSVTLNKDGEVTIVVRFTGIKDHKVDLLHVWLAGTGDPKQNGTGLAIDCLKPGKTKVVRKGDTFTIIDAKGASGAKFGEGPATVSAIAQLLPTKKGLRAEVIQWGRTLKLVKGRKR
jgi:hypothetical protein